MGLHMDNKEKKTGLQDSKRKRDSFLRRFLQDILQQGARSSGATSRGAGTISEATVEVSAKGRDEPVMRNLPEVTTRTPLSGVSSTDIQLQGASSYSIPAELQTFSLQSSQAPPYKHETVWIC
jgi:hypothetical protein